ncbi:MAG: hypothetical protein ACOVK2_05620 [Candidatus Fonsibacter sp.]
MKDKFLSTEHYIAYLQLESDYKNFIVHYEDYINSKVGSEKFEKQKFICIKYLESAIEQKTILQIDIESDTKKLFNLKYN